MNSISIRGLTAAKFKAVQKKARNLGKTAPQYVRALIDQDLLADQSLDELLRPIREDFRKSGVTEKQLDQIVERARSAAYRPVRRPRR
jgi:hypothetical protein